MLIKVLPDATVCRYLFTAKLLYMFRVSQHPSSGVLRTVTAAPGTGHNTGAATSLQRGLIGTGCITTLVVCSCFDVCWSFGVAGWGGMRVAGQPAHFQVIAALTYI